MERGPGGRREGRAGGCGGLLWDIRGVLLGNIGGQNGGMDSRGQEGGHGGYRGLYGSENGVRKEGGKLRGLGDGRRLWFRIGELEWGYLGGQGILEVR